MWEKEAHIYNTLRVHNNFSRMCWGCGVNDADVDSGGDT